MDEFDRIREFSEDISKRKEPSFEPVLSETAPEGDDADQYEFKEAEKASLTQALDVDLEEKEFSSMKLHLIALGIFAAVLTVVLVGFFIFNNPEEENEVVMVSATSDPVKVKPLDAGGMKIPDQDKLVYDRLRSNTVSTKVESLFPEPEKPVAPDILKSVPEEEFVSMSDTVPFNPLTDVVEPAPKTEAIPLPEKESAPAVKPVEKKTQQVAAKKTQAAPKTAVTPKGKWSVQLMSATKKESAEKAWPQMLKKHKALLSNMSYAIVKADIPGKGTYYRLRVGNFQTREQANALCKKLKARKQDCVPAN